MSDQETEARQYFINGEVPAKDWELVLSILGRLGVNAYSVDEEEKPGDLKQANENLEPGFIPYSLESITSPEQYLSNEHLGEFWPEYSKAVQNQHRRVPNKHEALCWGINLLASPERRGVARSGHRATQTERKELAAKLGLKVVEPRSLVGFSDRYAPHAYGLWASYTGKAPQVIEVGSFISSVRHIAELETAERPFGIHAEAVRFFVALADKLESQINLSKSQESTED